MAAPLDMKTPIFNREQVNSLINGFKLVDMAPSEMPRDWTIHVGPGSIARLSFSGPIGADEWDALLAHIAFYKQWYKDKPTTPLLNLTDAVNEIMNRLDEQKASSAPNGSRG
ncbi:hypothetical protein ABIF26_008251 [Bradyrhizobium elkanii]|uniref:hypothetical protein n=1 Tax=Bradyrhizobium elkanii TaxID=29448 RepID=UPI003515CD27